MYDIGDIKGIHFCLLVFARGKWKKKHDKKLIETLKSIWEKLLAESMSSEKDTLFDPKKLGKKLKDCQICFEAFELLDKERGKDKGFILFSHFVPEAIKAVLEPLLDDPQVQKVYYLEQNSAYFMYTPEKFIEKIKAKEVRQVSKVEFFRQVDQGRFETGILYKIFPKLQY